MQWHWGFLKENIRYTLFFMFRICFYLFFLDFRNLRLKSVIFKWILPFFALLSPPYFLEITIMAHEKNLEKQKYPKCIFSMHLWKHVKNVDTLLWNLGLDPQYHAIKVTLLNFQSSNYAGKLAYILLYPKTKLFMQQIRILISRIFYVPISPTFCGQYI